MINTIKTIRTNRIKHHDYDARKFYTILHIATDWEYIG